jgi:predicted 2-oxoglutarate/Fe(II)-dependent dioxygenase YbiX
MSLELGDFIPFIKIQGVNFTKDIHNYCDGKWFLFVCSKTMDSIIEYERHLLEYTSKFNIITVSPEKTNGNTKLNNKILYTIDNQLNKILNIADKITIYIVSPNRRIKHIINDVDLTDLSALDKYVLVDENTHIPFLMIENALDDALLNKVINYLNESKINNNTTSHNHATKNRLHVHPNSELEKELDNKLSRSVFPELMKVFYMDVSHRETYKICSYDSETRGRFHMHRDTPEPYQHRKYAMSLLLNDDYEGGEFVLPEYGFKIKPKANTAFIFPGISTHQVLEVTKGSRMAIITFFVNGQLRPEYKMKSHFYRDLDIKYSKIYPL